MNIKSRIEKHIEELSFYYSVRIKVTLIISNLQADTLYLCRVLNLHFHFFALVSRQSSALRSATQHAIPPEFSRKWGTECFNTRFPLPNLLSAGYGVKLI